MTYIVLTYDVETYDIMTYNVITYDVMTYDIIKSKKKLKIDLKSIFNHEGGTQIFRLVAQN